MTIAIAVVRVEGAGLPGSVQAAAEAGLLVSELEQRGHLVQRWRAHPHQLESLMDQLIEDGCVLFAIEAIAPPDVLQRIQSRLETRPIVLFGPLALSTFESTAIPFALVGASRRGLGDLADLLGAPAPLRTGGVAPAVIPMLAERLRQVPNLFYRPDLVGADARTGNERGPGGAVDVSERRAEWSPDVDLVPFLSPLVWNYHGPARDPMDDRRHVPIVAGRGCVHGPSANSPPTASDFAQMRPVGYSERAWQHIFDLHCGAETCPNGLCPPPIEVPMEHILTQADHWWAQGARSFELLAPDPFPAAAALLDALGRSDRIPEEIRMVPTPRVLRQREPVLTDLLAKHPEVRINIGGMAFFLAGRAPGLPSSDTSQWEARSIARVLQRLQDQHGPRLEALRDHELRLLDPYSTLEELLDALQALEEDAPFLKVAVSVDPPWILSSRYSPVARHLRANGLLRDHDSLGVGFCARSAEIPLYQDLVQRGMAPLLEAVGRLRLPPRERDRLAVEGRFRWFRELARFIVSRRGEDRPPADGWGRVLAGVTGELGLDRTPPR